ncbi:nitrate- and nitrite sensing domain-containing protein [Streptomyces thinghirensis]|nr:nitrate- and nitrite sensing domain-containing protein [Streptomyces thinghirensis]
MGTEAALALQKERGLSAAHLAEPGGDRTELDAQRKKTDEAVAPARRPVRRDRARPPAFPDRLYRYSASGGQPGVLPQPGGRPQRHHLRPGARPVHPIIDEQIHAFQELSHRRRRPHLAGRTAGRPGARGGAGLR